VRDTEIDDALGRLDLETKVRLLSGQDMWTLPAIPEIGLRSLVMSDGPIGVRGVGWAPDDPSVALPSPTALAATWDPELAERAGRLLGQECRRKGVHVLLAPTVNLHRSPLGGRHFECYSEDPVLTAAIGVGYIRGLQGAGVGCCVKHYVANDSETERFTVDVQVSEKALRELYLVPFEAAVEAGAWSVMAAYNGVNGAPMCENRPLLVDVLKDQWGFDGPVVSDWTAARSTAPTANGGLDVVMPALGDPWGDALVAAVRAGHVAPEVVDDKVRRVLRFAARVGAWGDRPGADDAGVMDAEPPSGDGAGVTDAAGPPAGDGAGPGEDGEAVAREIAARSFVLARNAGGVLPLDPPAVRRVAVLGALADDARIQGGGSAQVTPVHAVSPLAGLTAALPDAEVAYAVGADPRPHLPPARGLQWTPITATLRDTGGGELYRADLDAAAVRWMGGLPAGVDESALDAIELSATFTPAVGGTHHLSVIGFGLCTLTVGGKVLFDGPLYDESEDEATTFLSPVEHRVPLTVEAGRPVDVVLSRRVFEGTADFVNVALGHGAPVAADEELLDEAAAVAASADVAVVVVGTTEEVESEGFDRTTLALPGRQDDLVRRVAAANPRTVVVVNAGSPVLLPWADEVAAVVLTWFPGQEAGAALADVLLGAREPGGRLPTTWPRRAEDPPVLSTTPVGGVLAYAEGTAIGYRGWTAEPLFPFGHGLGYTTWEYESLSVDDGVAVVTVRNTGPRPGREVVQVYVDGRLAAFATAVAGPGESATVRAALAPRAVQEWVEGEGWRPVPGTHRVTVAHDVTDVRLAVELSL
jgi:beta-glucosidase